MILQNRTAIITGAARGIGAAIATLFAENGANLILADLDEPAAQALAATFPKARAIRADITSPVDAETIAQAAIDAYGTLDILVNNAGIGMNKSFMDTTPEDMARVLAINLTGTMLCSQAALRRMIPARYGRIVNISSISGQRGSTGRTAYGASKAGIDIMTKVMTAELAHHGVTINAIAPGAVETEMAATLHTPETRQAFHARTPAARYGAPAEIAAAALFLASESAGYVNGQVLAIDGGLTSSGIVLPT